MKRYKQGLLIFAGTALIVFVFSLLGAGGVAWWMHHRSEDKLERLLSSFRTGTVHTEFRSYATQLQGSGRFQFASLNEHEVFERRSTASLFWSQLQLPDVIVSLRVPVEYIYFLDLDKPWKFEFVQDRIQVKVPAIEFNRPAVDFSKIETRIDKGSWFRDEKSVLKGLQGDLSQILESRAKEKIPLVRETARRKTQEFVQWWLQNTYGSSPMSIHIEFSDEAPATPSL